MTSFPSLGSFNGSGLIPKEALTGDGMLRFLASSFLDFFQAAS